MREREGIKEKGLKGWTAGKAGKKTGNEEKLEREKREGEELEGSKRGKEGRGKERNVVKEGRKEGERTKILSRSEWRIEK